ncbi:MAG: GNAT family N-acetyltransferase [Frankiales bacterium]|nr:GNAT family N-acetyltransferase [Frankiales bacterium]
MLTTRLVSLDDAAELAAVAAAEREFLAPWEPARTPEWFTEAGQATAVALVLDDHSRGGALPHVIVEEDDAGGSARIVGRITLSGIVRGPFLSANLGYWVRRDCTGRGVATRAAARMVGIAFGELGLHRLQAGTLRHNHASQKVLARNGFERFGLAPRYLRIAGTWQDHVLFQLLNEQG